MGRRGEAQSARRRDSEGVFASVCEDTWCMVDVPAPTRSMDTVCAILEVYVLSIRRLLNILISNTEQGLDLIPICRLLASTNIDAFAHLFPD